MKSATCLIVTLLTTALPATAQDSWRMTPDLAPCPKPISLHGMATLDGKIYVIGGNDPITRALYNSTLVFDPVAGTWSERSPMPTAWNGGTAVPFGGKIYCFGGEVGGGVTGANFAYDPATDTWEARAPMPTARGVHVGVATSTRIYAFGGYPGGVGWWLANMEEYNPETNTWRVCSPLTVDGAWFIDDSWVDGPVNFGLGFAYGGAINDRVYIAGGFADYRLDGTFSNVSSACFEYDPAADGWTRKADMPPSYMYGIYAGASAVLQGRLFCIGGELIYPAAEPCPYHADYHPAEDKWTERAQMPSISVAYVPAAVADRKIYVVGSDYNADASLVQEYTFAAAPELPPALPSGLIQSEVGGAEIVAGGALNGSTIELGSLIDYADSQVRLEVEVRRVGEDFKGIPNVYGSFSAGGVHTVRFDTGRISGSYKWQARATNGDDVPGDWVQFGADGVAADFTIGLLVITPVAPEDDDSGSGCGGSATGGSNGVIVLLLTTAVLAAARRGRVLASAFLLVAALPANAQDSWESKTGLEVPLMYNGCAEASGLVFVFNGMNGFTYEFYPENRAFDPVANAWTTRTPAPVAIAGMVAGRVDGIIYSVGGITSSFEAAPTLAYDPATDSWSTGRAMLLTTRFDMSGAVHNGRIYTIGGNNLSTFAAETAVESYDPATDTWRTEDPLPRPNAGGFSAAIRNRIYVAGWFEGAPNALYGYEPGVATWTPLASIPSTAAPEGMYGGCAAAVGGRMYCMGGGARDASGGYYGATHLEYRAEGDVWTSRAPLVSGITWGRAAVVDGKVIAVGMYGFSAVEATYVQEYTPPAIDGPVPAPLNMVQLDSTGAAIPGGSNVAGWEVSFGADVQDLDWLATGLRLEVERRASNASFLGEATNSTETRYSGPFQITVPIVPLGTHKWQARLVSATGAASEWVKFGDPLPDPDFMITEAPPTPEPTPTPTPISDGGSDNGGGCSAGRGRGELLPLMACLGLLLVLRVLTPNRMTV